jgi:hypothetical protein
LSQKKLFVVTKFYDIQPTPLAAMLFRRCTVPKRVIGAARFASYVFFEDKKLLKKGERTTRLAICSSLKMRLSDKEEVCRNDGAFIISL